MADPFFGEIRAFGFNYPPRDWAFCNGDSVPIRQNTALYSVIGTQFGGDGINTFQLPNLQGMAPMHAGAIPGTTDSLTPGESVGATTVTLNLTQVPSHSHQVFGGVINPNSEMTSTPANNSLLSRPLSGNTAYWALSNQDAPNSMMSPVMIGVTGSGEPHNNMQPYLPMNFCICLYGEYPVPAS